MAASERRISVDLPVIPHALRGFIEDVVQHDRAMRSFMESPKDALHGAGVPLDDKNLNRKDFDSLIRVIGNLRKMVLTGKLSKDFEFEEVFGDIACATHIDEMYTTTEATAWPSGRASIAEPEPSVPLLGRESLALIAEKMQTKVNARSV